MAGSADYKNNWQRENLDRINLTVPKGYKAELQAHARSMNESVTAFINRAVREAIAHDRLEEKLKPQIIAFAAEIAARNDGELPTDADVAEFNQLVEAFTLIEQYIPDVRQRYLERRFPKCSGPRVQTIHISKRR